MVVNITPHRPVFRVAVGSQIVVPQQGYIAPIMLFSNFCTPLTEKKQGEIRSECEYRKRQF